MASLQLNTFLRSAIAEDPFCLGDIGPEDVLRIESEFPALFGEVENTISEIKKEEVKPKNSLPLKHDCLSKTVPPKPNPTRGKSNLMQRNVNKTLQASTSSARKLQEKISETEATRNAVSHGKVGSLPVTELRSTLSDILRRFEQDFPQEIKKGFRARESRANSIANKTVKHKSNVQLLHIKKVETNRPEITRKNIPSDVQTTSNSLPNVVLGSRKAVNNPKLPKGNFPSKHFQGNISEDSSSRKATLHDRDADATRKPNVIPASRTTATETKSGPGYLRNAIFNLPKPKPGSSASQSKKNIVPRKQSVENRASFPQRKTESNKANDFNRNFAEKRQIAQTLSESDSLSESLLENNPLKQRETTVNALNTGQIHIRKPIAEMKDEIKVPDKIPIESVTGFEQLLLARTLASQYERQGRFHKHHTLTSPKKSVEKEPELPDPMRNILSPNFLRDFQANTPGCKEVLEKIAEELIYVEVLKYLDTEQQADPKKRSNTEQKAKPDAKQRSNTEHKSTQQTTNIDSKLVDKESKEENLSKSEISSGRSNAGLSTINEESEIELVTPDLTPPQSLLHSGSKENETDKSSFLTPASSEDESTVLETPELTPVAKHSLTSKSSTLGKVSDKTKNDIAQHHATNETTDCSELSDFLFTEVKIDSEIKSKSSEKLVTPILSVEQLSESIAEKELPKDSPISSQSGGIGIETPKSSIEDETSHENKPSCESSPNKKKTEVLEEEEENSENSNKANVTFKSPPVVEFRLPKKNPSTKQFPTKSQSVRSRKLIKKSESSFGDILVSETGGSVSIGSYTGRTEASVTENLSDGELVVKRYQSPGELSASFYLSPGIYPFSYPEVNSSDDSEDGYALSEGAAFTELSLGEVVATRRSSHL